MLMHASSESSILDGLQAQRSPHLEAYNHNKAPHSVLVSLGA